MEKVTRRKIVCVLTATRAEYGLLKNVIKKLEKVKTIDTRLAVTGTHLVAELGNTYQEIEQDGIKIDTFLSIQEKEDSPQAISKIMANALLKFSEYFLNLRPDLLIVLGDRYETLAVCIAAMNEKIPIAHLYGGETTEGAIDECIRHAITKFSYLHFTSTEEYKRRVIQLGENPKRVFYVGSLGVENILNTTLMSKESLEDSIQFKLDRPYGVVTFHPETLDGTKVETQIKEVLSALEAFGEFKFIITKANADAGGRSINRLCEKFALEHDNCILVSSLGMHRYLSALQYAAIIIGNSSSGIVEAPSFRIPVVNIGDRQKGRIQAENVVNCPTEKIAIIDAVKCALKKNCDTICNPYDKNGTSDVIVAEITKVLDAEVDLKKVFYNI